MSPSVWRVWIEMVYGPEGVPILFKSPSVWRVWIEMMPPALNPKVSRSPSVWRVWIQIFLEQYNRFYSVVTLRVEGVD